MKNTSRFVRFNWTRLQCFVMEGLLHTCTWHTTWSVRTFVMLIHLCVKIKQKRHNVLKHLSHDTVWVFLSISLNSELQNTDYTETVSCVSLRTHRSASGLCAWLRIRPDMSHSNLATHTYTHTYLNLYAAEKHIRAHPRRALWLRPVAQLVYCPDKTILDSVSPWHHRLTVLGKGTANDLNDK